MTKPRPTLNLNAALRAKFSPQTPIHEATLSTVTIKTALATGSGFFISSTGHLLTNKHVIQLPEQERKTIQQTFGAVSYTHLDVYKRQQMSCGRARVGNPP